MPIDRFSLLDQFGSAVDAGVGALFVGAGLSAASGLPDWDRLLAPLAHEIGLDGTMNDLPLFAEYFEQHPDGGRLRLEDHLRQQLTPFRNPNSGHQMIGQLPVLEIWTTNFDTLIEAAIPEAHVALRDDDALGVGTTGKSIIKMHGSLAAGDGWDSPPIITRGDFERYETSHPRMWSLLRASYLTRTMLFLGFSFADPNVDLLLQLARRYNTTSTDKHMTVLRRPSAEPDLSLHNLRVRDLELSGVRVCETADHGELVPLLHALVRRTRPQRLFISGSGDEKTLLPWCERLARRLVGLPADWQLASLGGPAGWWTTQRVAASRRTSGNYEPEKYLLYFRRKPGEGAPDLDDRVGTAIFSDLDREPLARSVLDSCRAMLVVQGGSRTAEEVTWAREMGVGVVPLAASGGTARTVWGTMTSDRPLFGGQELPATIWEALADSDPDVATQAAARALEQAMFFQTPA